jgi:hypothetical protein
VKPKTFKSFPASQTCPICGTNSDEECVLIPIDGTQKGNLVECIPTHLWCAVGSNFNRDVGIIYRRVKGSLL